MVKKNKTETFNMVIIEACFCRILWRMQCNPGEYSERIDEISIWLLSILALLPNYWGLRWNFYGILYKQTVIFWKFYFQTKILRKNRKNLWILPPYFSGLHCIGVGALGSVMVKEIDLQTYKNDFTSHWVPLSFGLVPYLSKKISKLLHCMGILCIYHKYHFFCVCVYIYIYIIYIYI